jgi:hypothetical protein
MDDALAIPGMKAADGCSRRSLERLIAGELDAAQAEKLRAHASSCAVCGPRLAELEHEAADFKREVAFDRFEAKVIAKGLESQRRGSKTNKVIGLAIAAGIAALVIGLPQLSVFKNNGTNTLKGSDGTLELFVGGTGAAPRMAKNGEALSVGERVRVGYQARDHRFVLIFSVDEQGVATALYPESGPSLPIEKSPGTHLMADSLELTGNGREKVIALFSDEPLLVAHALEAASLEFRHAGSLDAMKPLPLPLRADESSLTLKKPEK